MVHEDRQRFVAQHCGTGQITLRPLGLSEVRQRHAKCVTIGLLPCGCHRLLAAAARSGEIAQSRPRQSEQLQHGYRTGAVADQLKHLETLRQQIARFLIAA